MNNWTPPDVGAHVRALRQRRGLSLRALAELCELSPNTISLVERGASSPSVATLHRLATALGVPITAFFEQEGEKVELVLTRADERPRAGSASILLESLGSGLLDQTLAPFAVTLKPGACSGDQGMVHAGHELVYCLRGELEYEVAGQLHRLTAGDALLFEARLPHRWCNPGDDPAEFLLIFETPMPEESMAQHLHS
ncbi:MAG: cupin domain-containing protein [Chloroflexi bacterium]|nr:cupin domain-containing protein [Chloroflexota bacterium]MBU1751512.1 cupin domain-containing protein [Chloroflexota bacterium]MBU1879555.1 cupin domain-containing protein [Chloroflexota bacterium]